MTYIYHGVPENMKGSKLIPLSEMMEIDPKLQAEYLKKYKGREEILDRKIQLLNCLWNDVVQLLPIHPRHLFELQKELGLIDEIPNYRYFKIDSNMLDSEKTVVYFKTAPGDENVIVKWVEDVDLSSLHQVPPATVHYYQNMVGTDQPVFNYQFVPHIIHKGVIDVSNAEIINLTS